MDAGGKRDEPGIAREDDVVELGALAGEGSVGREENAGGGAYAAGDSDEERPAGDGGRAATGDARRVRPRREDGPARGASDIAEARVGLVQRRANATSLFDEA